MGAIIGSPPAYQNQRPSGKLYLNNDQLNLVDSAPTLVLLDTIPAAFVDGIENVATHRITPGVAGWYSIAGQVWFDNVIAAKKYRCAIMVSNQLVAVNYNHSSLADTLSCLCSVPCHYLTAVNYVELWATSFAGVHTVDIGIWEQYTYLAVQRVR